MIVFAIRPMDMVRVVVIVVVMVVMVVVIMAMMMGAVIMRAVVMGAMIMVVVIMAVMLVALRGNIVATFRLKGRLNFNHPGAKRFGEFGHGGVMADTQLCSRNLQWHMPVSQMVSNGAELMRLSLDFHKRLWRGNHLHKAAILQLQRIAMAQAGLTREIKQKFRALQALQVQVVGMTVAEFEDDAVDGVLPITFGNDRCCPQQSAHFLTLSHDECAAKARHHLAPNLP